MCEILIPNDLEHIETLTMFLVDFYPEIQDFIFPKCSLVNLTYQMDYDTGKNNKKMKRLKRPSRWFQEKLKKILPAIYPRSLGKEYYGNPVFTTFKNLFLNQVHNLKKKNDTLMENHNYSKSSNIDPPCQSQQDEIIFQNDVENLPDLPFPSRTMITADFPKQKNHVEFRFQQYLNIDKLQSLQTVIEQIPGSNQKYSNKIQFRFIYDTWETDLFHRNASQDVIILANNNLEFALKERNWKALLPSNQAPMWSIYFQLTSMIDDNDFRLEEFQKVWNYTIFLK
jgi:hypothetical protein